jgi:hypothetical protein
MTTNKRKHSTAIPAKSISKKAYHEIYPKKTFRDKLVAVMNYLVKKYPNEKAITILDRRIRDYFTANENLLPEYQLIEPIPAKRLDELFETVYTVFECLYEGDSELTIKGEKILNPLFVFIDKERQRNTMRDIVQQAINDTIDIDAYINDVLIGRNISFRYRLRHKISSIIKHNEPNLSLRYMQAFTF